MPREDDWEDDYDDRPRRRRRDDDDDYDDDYRGRSIRRAGHSGAVTAVGVISIVLGSLFILLGICVLLGAALTGGAARELRDQPGAGVVGILAGAVVIVALLILVLAVLLIVGGIGVLNRRNWGRILTLVLGGLSAVVAVFWILVAVSTLNNNAMPDDRAGPILVSLILVFLHIGYAVLVFVVLLNSVYAEEFE